MANPKAYSVMYDSLPPPAAASSAPAATSSAGGATSAVASGGGGGNNKRPADSQSSSSASGSGGGLPEGWKRVPSRSRPGAFTYENQYTKERISWVPDRPASRKMKDLPPEPPRAPKPQRPSDPEEAKRESAEKLKIFLEKLQEHLATDEKYGAACKLLHKSLFSSAALSQPEICDLYFEVLRATQAVPERCHRDPDRRYLKHVFKVVQEKRSAFPKKYHYQLDTWILRSLSHNELFTDDSFQFNRAAKAFTDALLEVELRSKKRIVELMGTEADQQLEELEAVPAELVKERKRVIVEVLATLHGCAKLPWQVSTCNAVFKEVTDRRGIFDPEEHAVIDAANDVRLARKAPRKEDHTGSLQGRVLARQSKF